MALSDGTLSATWPGIERIASSAESETSAFSNATEITEGEEFFNEEGSMTPRQTYFMCYATDLLSAYEKIKKRSLTGIKAVDDVSAACCSFHCWRRQ